MNPDEFEPTRSVPKPVDMQPMSIGELKQYIGTLEAEITRAHAAIAQKEALRNGIAGLFKT